MGKKIMNDPFTEEEMERLNREFKVERERNGEFFKDCDRAFTLNLWIKGAHESLMLNSPYWNEDKIEEEKERIKEYEKEYKKLRDDYWKEKGWD